MRMRQALLGLGVGLALADSSIVTLAVPEILGDFDVAITSVAWLCCRPPQKRRGACAVRRPPVHRSVSKPAVRR